MTWQPTEDIIAAALWHAERDAPNESCGVVANGEYWTIDNRSNDPEFGFMLDRTQYLAVVRQFPIEAIVHSHPYMQPIASDPDRTMCERLGLPYLIVAWPLKTWVLLQPCGFRAPLVGRQFSWGSHDCYGLIRDALAEYGGIEIQDFERGNWEWWKAGEDKIAKQFELTGFVRMPQGTKPQHLDVLGMQIASPVVNHLGVFLEPDQFIHQLAHRLSVREVYGGIYAKATVLHMRCGKFC